MSHHYRLARFGWLGHSRGSVEGAKYSPYKQHKQKEPKRDFSVNNTKQCNTLIMITFHKASLSKRTVDSLST